MHTVLKNRSRFYTDLHLHNVGVRTWIAAKHFEMFSLSSQKQVATNAVMSMPVRSKTTAAITLDLKKMHSWPSHNLCHSACADSILVTGKHKKYPIWSMNTDTTGGCNDHASICRISASDTLIDSEPPYSPILWPLQFRARHSHLRVPLQVASSLEVVRWHVSPLWDPVRSPLLWVSSL